MMKRIIIGVLFLGAVGLAYSLARNDNNNIYPNFLVIQNHLLQSLDNAQIMDLKFG